MARQRSVARVLRTLRGKPTSPEIRTAIGTDIYLPNHSGQHERFNVKTGSDASGDVYFRDSNGNFTSLAIGTISQRLESDGSKPFWADQIAAATPTWAQTLAQGSTTNGDNPRIKNTDKLEFSSTSITIATENDGDLDLNSEATIDFQIQAAEEMSLTPNRLTFNNGATTTALDWNNNGQIRFIIGTTAECLIGADFMFFNNGLVDTRITWATSGILKIRVGTLNQIGFTDGTIQPETNNDIDLGTSSLGFKNYYGVGGQTLGIVAKTATYTATASDHVITCGAGNETFTVTLPAIALHLGRIYHIKNVGTGTITVATPGLETIDGASTAVINTQYDSIMLIAGASEWHVI